MASKDELVASYLARLSERKDLSLLLARSQGGLEAAEAPGASAMLRAAEDGITKIKDGRVPPPEQTAALEAIILPKIRPVLDVVDGDFHTDHPLWLKLNDDEALRGRLHAAITSIGRIELPGHPDYPYGGTGFVVGPGLVMTNRHVAGIFASGVGMQVTFKPGHRAGIDFLRELERPTGPTLAVTRVIMIHPYWDMALLAVEGLDGRAALRLSQLDASGAEAEVAAIGYPAFDTRNPAGVQNDLFRRIFGVKRLQPGTLSGVRQAESFGKLVPALGHTCSTLGGNSGSALVDLATGDVLALHFGGLYSVMNYGVPARELAKDPRVLDAGVRFSGEPQASGDPWAAWWERPRADRDDADGAAAASPTRVVQATTAQAGAHAMADGSISISVPLHVTIRLGSPAPTAAADQVEVGIGTEGLVIPWHDEDYGSRRGYRPDFIGAGVPMPRPADPSVVALAKDGSSLLHYENFSVAMHARRCMALFTASNVTAEPRFKKPEPGRSYSRKALSGLGRNDQERWFPDPRMDNAFQLPDVFYTRDDGAFDKGHIVRREDVAWGETFEALRRANGDTYHVTNCSPQVAGFNRSTEGEDNWGDLENHVLKGAASERYCQFAGPILDPADEVFVGAGGGRVRLRVKIPSRYWKVIVVRTASGIASYGFVLEQDLSQVPTEEEFVVPANFRRFMEPLAELERKAGIVFPDEVRLADQHDTDEGVELAMRAGLRRRAAGAEAPTETMVL